MYFEFVEREDWRVAQMTQCGLDRPRLEKILNAIRDELGWSPSAEVKVAVLEPGLSGFQVLRVTCAGHSSIILKLKQYPTDNECNAAASGDKAASTKLQVSAPPHIIATVAFHVVVTYSTVNMPEEYWLCLVYRDVGKGRTTFKRFYSERIRASDFKIADEQKHIEEVLYRYAQMGWVRWSKTAYSWSGPPADVKPLEQKAFLGQYRHNVWAAFVRRPDLAGVIGIDPGAIHELIALVEHNLYRGQSIESKASDVLFGDVHGDFNGGNVLVSEANGEDAVFIDFGQIGRESPGHAMYDVGKLSIEFERFILPESAFDLNRPLMLKAWTDIHNCWAQDESIEGYNRPPFTVLFRLYSLLSTFRDFAVKMFVDRDIDAEVANRHFLYVRLHHVLRIINHSGVDAVRKLFAVRASLDILAVLTQPPRPCKCNTPQPPIFFDCTAEEFQRHLAMANSATIVGLTNAKLAEHLRKAWEKRGRTEWGDIRVVFLARHLLEHVHDPDGCEPGKSSSSERWDQAVEDVRGFFFRTGSKATHVEIRHSDNILPFVGQLYDGERARVAFIHPERDMTDNCYINFPSKPPCSVAPFVVSRELTDGPPCKTSQVDSAICETCTWYADHSPCVAIKNSFKHIQNSSTPLLAANVVGQLDQDGAFCYMCLIPQKDWQLFKFPDNILGPPAHLQTFVLLRYKEEFLLLKRNETNSSDNRGKLSVISGKVNDEDCLDDPPDLEHRTKVFEMQVAFDELGDDEESLQDFWTNHLFPLAKSFGLRAGLSPEEPVPKEHLKNVGEKAGVRYAQEKLRFRITAERLRHVPGRFIVHRKASSCENPECKDKKKCRDPSHGFVLEHVLFPVLFVLDIGGLEKGSVSISEIERLTVARFQETLKLYATAQTNSRFTEFLQQHGEAIVEWHKINPWKAPR